MPTAYQTDFYAWTQDQARQLREAAAARVNLPLDFENLAEEVESMGRSDARAVNSALTRILEHLLKLEYSPAAGPRDGWEESVNVQRLNLRDVLADSPSLHGRIDLERCWRDGRRLAARGLNQDGIAPGALPVACPYTLDQAFDESWWPANRHGLA